MIEQPGTASSIQPIGTGRDLRRRFLLHHVPVAIASAAILVIFMDFPLGRHADIFSGTFPQGRGEGGGMDHGGGQTMGHGGGQTAATAATDHGAGRQMGHGRGQQMGHGASQTGQAGHGEGQSGQTGHGARTGRTRPGGEQAGPTGHGGGQAGSTDHAGGQTGRGRTAQPDSMDPDGGQNRSFIRQFTMASGYVALALTALTLLIGPANLLLGRRTPISNYLSRDVGTWAAIGSVAHTIFALQAHGSGRIRDFLAFFIAQDGSPLVNSFGLGNWTGLAALVIVTALFAISSDAALRKLKARPWKRLQRLNYVLFALVVLHAYFYGALLRVTSPFTMLLGASVVVVFVGQALGVWLWRRRYSAPPRTGDPQSANA